MTETDTETETEHLYDVIRRAGGRITVPTRTLIEILLGNHGHLTAEELIAEVDQRTPGVAPSTIYRLLQRFDELEIIEHVHSGTGPTFYQLRERGHAHLVCNGCGAIIDIPDRAFDPLVRRIKDTYHFAIDPHHAALLGQCADCAS
jgi:Fur family transcriptional regulator, ferric uptake regulator